MAKTAYSLAVYSTEDYTDFKKLKGNRELSQYQVNRLAKVIKRDPDFTKGNPVIVNSKMEVVDGQHRIQAFKNYQSKTGETHPIYYVIKDNWSIANARELNAGSKAWTPIDYAKAYASEGNKNYATFVELAEEFAYPAQVIMYALGRSFKLPTGPAGGATPTMRLFREGKFEVEDGAKARQDLENLREITQKYPFLSSRSGATAILQMIRAPKYSQSRMLSQLKEFSSVLHSVPDKVQEIRYALNSLYNMGDVPRVDLVPQNLRYVNSN